MGRICIFAGSGHGKSSAALGGALIRATQGESVVVIQFLKGSGIGDSEFIKRLEPEIKVFHFEKSEENFDELDEKHKEEEIINIKNGINYARKVLSTGECDLLVLDEILGIVDMGIIDSEELVSMLAQRDENVDVIITGINVDEKVSSIADSVSVISMV